MNRPPHEPTRRFRPAHRLLDNAASNATALGCAGCPDLAQCGGLHTEAGIFDCDSLCSCGDPSACDMVCRNRPNSFVQRFIEVGGFELGNVPRVAPLAAQRLPEVVPYIDHKYRRARAVEEPVVAVPLYELFNLSTGEPLVRSRTELAARFLIPDEAVVIATGVNRDAKLEAWWAFADRPPVTQVLKDLGIALVTAPNFSLFIDVPRPDNLHSIKRIALSWAELMAAGIPAALHVNARTDHDYRRWTRFIQERPEVAFVAFEFGTGAGFRGRMDWHVDHLCQLAEDAGRELTLIVRGGAPAQARLRRHFARVVLIETDAFAKTMKRRKATLNSAGRLRWAREHTAEGEALDDLLAHNIAARRASLLTSNFAPVSAAARSIAGSRPTQNADRKSGRVGDVRQLNLPLEARAMAANFQSMVTAPKPEIPIIGG